MFKVICEGFMNFKNFIEVVVKVKNKRFNSVLILKKELEEN